MNMEHERRLLESLTQGEGILRRTTDLLKAPDADSPNQWHMCVPSCFNAALDIRYSERKKNKKPYWVWTQGADFSFAAGDIIYDTPDGYKVWSEALKSIKRCVQISEAKPAGGAEEGDRYSGLVKAKVFRPNEKRSALCLEQELQMTQYDFVSYLIFGRPE